MGTVVAATSYGSVLLVNDYIIIRVKLLIVTEYSEKFHYFNRKFSNESQLIVNSRVLVSI